MDAELAVKVAWITACTMALISTLGVDAGGGAGGAGGAGTMDAGEAMAGH